MLIDQGVADAGAHAGAKKRFGRDGVKLGEPAAKPGHRLPDARIYVPLGAEIVTQPAEEGNLHEYAFRFAFALSWPDLFALNCDGSIGD